MNEPQVWTVIGVLAAALLGGLTVITQLILRTLQAEIGTVRVEIGSLRTEMRAEIGALRGITEAKFEGLDRDVQALTHHVFGSSPRE